MGSYHLAAPLADSSVFVTAFEGCDLRLVDDARYLWLLLIPQKEEVFEWHDLNAHERHQLIDTASAIADIIQTQSQADKMNLATIGNIVPHFHFHIIARFKTDEAWPQPVWGRGQAVPYEKDALATKLSVLQSWLAPLALQIKTK